jgi:hypothetical protein
MNLEISKEGVFIPEFNGNKNLPVTDQIMVRYKIPTVTIKNRCRKKPQAKGIASTNGNIDHMEITVEKDETTTVKEMLVSISGCSYSEKGGKPVLIISAQDLFNAPIQFESLLKEIVDEFDNILDHSEINEKN